MAVAPNTARTVFYTVRTIVRPNSRIVIFSPYCSDCRPSIRLTNNQYIRIRLKLGSFSVSFRGLASTVAPHAQVVILGAPRGPDNTLVDHTRLSRLTTLVHSHSVCLVDSRICRRLIFSNITRIDILGRPRLCRQTFIVDSFNGACRIAN